MSTYWSLHTHTRESAKDALPSVKRTVAKAKELGYPALGLTDHGTVSGAVDFYRECRKHDIEPLIGVEAYVAFDRSITTGNSSRPATMHACIVAYTEEGWRNLTRLVTRSAENFKFIPVLDLGDLAEAYSAGQLRGLLMTSGCWFGLLPTMMREYYLGPLPNVTKALSKWFDGMFFVEIQNHQVVDQFHNDETHSLLLSTWAEAYDLPVVITQDSHYLSAHDQKTHDAFKMLSSWNTEDPDAATFPGDGYHMVDTAWMEEHHAPHIFERGMAGLDLILSKARLRIPELDVYELKVPDTTVSGDPDAELAALVADEMEKLLPTLPKGKRAVYRQRLADELDVITASGFAGYLMLVHSVTEWLDEQSIVFRVRGSATGSLACWLLGITGYDPIRWNLSFERFLSRDRTKPPDIDLDVEHERRHQVIEWLDKRFYTVQISTTHGYKVKGDDDDPSGSLIVAFKQRQRNLGLEPDAPIPDTWMRNLRKIAEYNGVTRDREPIDPPLKAVSQHPAGVVVVPNKEVLDSIPKRWIASSKTMVTAFEQDAVEALGLVKLDVLGVRTLTALRIAEDIADVDAEDFPLTDRKTYNRIAAGRTAGLFQLEGGATSSGVQRMRPNKISDLIAAMALFRPAAMDSGATESYLRRRVGAEQIPDRHPLIAAHTHDTYGVLIYQEQALGILKDLGLSVEEIEVARKAIKASNANVGDAATKLAQLMDHIKTLAVDAGMGPEDYAWLSEALNAYAGYSFNRAHATAYGILAYQTAYMATHHPVAFWTGTLVANADAPPKFKGGVRPEVTYLRAAHNDGVKVLRPHVNNSAMTYTTDGVFVYRGLTSIQGVGPVAAQELVDNQPYSSLDDLAFRVLPRKVSGVRDLAKGHDPAACPGVIKALHEAGALGALQWNGD